MLPALGVVVVAGMCAVRPRGRGRECDHRSLPRRALTPLTLRGSRARASRVRCPVAETVGGAARRAGGFWSAWCEYVKILF